MSSTTMGVRLDEATRERIKTAARRIDRTPHWLIKQAIFNYLEFLDNEQIIPELSAQKDSREDSSDEENSVPETTFQPFLSFAEHILPQSVKRSAITSAYRPQKHKQCQCYYSKLSSLPRKRMRRISWPIQLPKNCAIKKMV